MTIQKGYYVCLHDGPQWWVCYGILDNGFCFGQHICSHPDFAPGDLLKNRKDRLAALKALVPDFEKVEFETVLVASKADVPEWWERLVNSQETQLSLAPMYTSYATLLKEAQ